MSIADTVVRLRYRLVPDHVLGELLSKRWSENFIPFVIMIAVIIYMGVSIPNFFGIANLSDSARQFGEFGLVTLAMMIVLVAGGIDLSVASVFALANIVSLTLLSVAGLPLWMVIPLTLLSGACVGLLNGILIGYLRLRAFLTTLATLIIVRSIVDLLLLKYSVAIASGFIDVEFWYVMGEENLLGLPFSFTILLALAIVLHVLLSRMRLGWRIMAVGGSRRSAYNVGIPVQRTVCITYVISSVLASLAGLLFAARLSGAGADTGMGLELMALTAAVLGGVGLGGGRGSVAKAMMGGVTILLLVNGLVRLGLPAGASSVALGLVLIFAVAVDVRFIKNLHKLISKIYVSPTYLVHPEAPDTSKETGGVYALNDRLRDVNVIGLGEIEGPEDVILDEQDNLYCGNRVGDIVRFFAPDYTRHEVFAHVGGHPLGMAFDRQRNLVVCIAGMGLYAIAPDRTVRRLTDETNRSWASIVDDSRLKLADDLDIAPDGKIYFSEATIRYEMHDWPVDALEGRGNGRIICYDPEKDETRTVLKNLVFPNGICVDHNGESILFAETWGCRINRYWLQGPKKGRVEVVIPDLPGYPDNINRSSDGTYWLALVGMRTPSMDLSMRMPGFRKRMARRVAADEWLFPNINTGCVVRFDRQGNILETLWDFGGKNHPMITSMREHKGKLYLGGISNNRIGQLDLPGRDASWTGPQSYWGKEDA